MYSVNPHFEFVAVLAPKPCMVLRLVYFGVYVKYLNLREVDAYGDVIPYVSEEMEDLLAVSFLQCFSYRL